MAEEDRKQSLSLWQGRKRRVIHSLVNCSFLKKDYSLAIDLIDTYILQDDSVKDLSPYYGVMGRICLELRDLQMAKLYFAKNQTTDKYVHISKKFTSFFDFRYLYPHFKAFRL